MKWVARSDAEVDRIACPWLIKRFVDPDAEFLFVPVDGVTAVAGREGAVPYGVSGVELVEGRSSFEGLLLKHGLADDEALVELARIVHAAGNAADIDSALEGWGVMAIACGVALLRGKDEDRELELEWRMFDALYAWCRHKLNEFMDER